MSSINQSTGLVLKEISSSRAKMSLTEELTLSQLSMYADQGELVALLGHSGIGKTSLLRLIMGLDPLVSGEIIWQKTLIQSSSYHHPIEDRHFAYCPQEPSLFPHLNVANNICFGLQNLKESERLDRMRWALSLVDLEEQYAHWPSQLSGGQQKRIALARALALKASLLILDEPFNSLDHSLKGQLQLRIFDELKKQGTTIIWSTHHVEEALQYADRLWLLTRSNHVIDGPPLTLYTRPPSREVAESLGPVTWIQWSTILIEHLAWPKLKPPDIHIMPSDEIYLGLRCNQWELLSKERSNDQYSEDILSLSGQVISNRKNVLFQTLELRIHSSKNHHFTGSPLPISETIRITLPSYLSIIVNQVIRVRYLGIAIFIKDSKEKA